MSTDDRITAQSGERIDPRLVRDFIHRALAHDAVADKVHQLLHDHVLEGRYDPSVIAGSLRRLLAEILDTATALDWRAVSDELIADARDTLTSEPSASGVAIDDEQRAAIYPQVFSDLSIAVSELNVALECGEWATARALRCRIEQDMRLLDDIGWATEHPRGSFELTISHETLAPTIERLHATTSSLTRELLADVLDGAGIRVLDAQEALAAILAEIARACDPEGC